MENLCLYSILVEARGAVSSCVFNLNAACAVELCLVLPILCLYFFFNFFLGVNVRLLSSAGKNWN